MKLLCCSQQTRKSYLKFNASRRGFRPRTEKGRDEHGSFLTDGGEMIEKWKQNYDERLNGEGSVDMEDL